MTAARDLEGTIDDLTFLADTGVGLTEAAQRVGFPSAVSCDKWLRLKGQGPLVNRLISYDYLPIGRASMRGTHATRESAAS